MTRRHFQALADAIRTEFADQPISRGRAAKAVANAARQFNPRFNESRFFQACGVQ